MIPCKSELHHTGRGFRLVIGVTALRHPSPICVDVPVIGPCVRNPTGPSNGASNSMFETPVSRLALRAESGRNGCTEPETKLGDALVIMFC